MSLSSNHTADIAWQIKFLLNNVNSKKTYKSAIK